MRERLHSEENGDTSDNSAGSQVPSRASTVEMAIVYIRSLQAELRESRDKLEAAEKSLEERYSSGSHRSDKTNG